MTKERTWYRVEMPPQIRHPRLRGGVFFTSAYSQPQALAAVLAGHNVKMLYDDLLLHAIGIEEPHIIREATRDEVAYELWRRKEYAHDRSRKPAEEASASKGDQLKLFA